MNGRPSRRPSFVTSVVGAAVAAAALRVSGPYLAMVTIAFGLIVEGVLIEWGSVDGRPGRDLQHPEARPSNPLLDGTLGRRSPSG